MWKNGGTSIGKEFSFSGSQCLLILIREDLRLTGIFSISDGEVQRNLNCLHAEVALFNVCLSNF